VKLNNKMVLVHLLLVFSIAVNYRATGIGSKHGLIIIISLFFNYHTYFQLH